MKSRAFTLIELLVVVLIIGILAAIALPQYRVAVQKAKLARLIPLADALYKAEEAYFLANGKYTSDLSLLDVQINCQFVLLNAQHGYYDCGDFHVGVYDGPINTQVVLKENDKSVLAYLHYLAEDSALGEHSLGAKKGDIACFAANEVNRQVCRSLGVGTETTYTGTWKSKTLFSN